MRRAANWRWEHNATNCADIFHLMSQRLPLEMSERPRYTFNLHCLYLQVRSSVALFKAFLVPQVRAASLIAYILVPGGGEGIWNSCGGGHLEPEHISNAGDMYSWLGFNEFISLQPVTPKQNNIGKEKKGEMMMSCHIFLKFSHKTFSLPPVCAKPTHSLFSILEQLPGFCYDRTKGLADLLVSGGLKSRCWCWSILWSV